jgi:hypothetical protein
MEILDPQSPESYLPESRMGELVAGMLNSPMIHSLDPDRLERRVRMALDGQEYTGSQFEDLRRLFILQAISVYCTTQLLEDERVLSQHHIAGEICRANCWLQLIADNEGFLDLVQPGGMNIGDNMMATGGNFWTPPGTSMVCPTIDGLSLQKWRLAEDTRQGMRGELPYHLLWRVNLTTWIDGQVKAGSFKIVEPPFRLNSGRLVESSDPPFYALTRSPGSELLIPDPGVSPPELVDA